MIEFQRCKDFILATVSDSTLNSKGEGTNIFFISEVGSIRVRLGIGVIIFGIVEEEDI